MAKLDGVSVVYKDTTYKSILALFRALNIKHEYKAFMRWKLAHECDNSNINFLIGNWINKVLKKSVAYHGKFYPSVEAIFIALNKGNKTYAFKTWIFKRKSQFESSSAEEKIDAYLNNVREKKDSHVNDILYHGKIYSSIKDVFISNNMTYSTWKSFMCWKSRRGFDPEVETKESLIDEFLSRYQPKLRNRKY